MKRDTTLISACCETDLMIGEDCVGNEIYLCSDCEEPLIMEVEEDVQNWDFNEHEEE